MTRRTSLDRDYERLARHVCGTARGVCLGGGGARGLAHVGVLKVMEEARLPIDFISGASQGAFIAAAYAMTLDIDASKPMIDLLEQRLGNTWTMIQGLTLPIFSYFDVRVTHTRSHSLSLPRSFDSCLDLWRRSFHGARVLLLLWRRCAGLGLQQHPPRCVRRHADRRSVDPVLLREHECFEGSDADSPGRPAVEVRSSVDDGACGP
jgi:hypothetical protein